MRVVPHQVNRLVIEITDRFEVFRQSYGGAVPQLDRERLTGLVLKRVSWDEVLAVTEAAAGLVLAARINQTKEIQNV